MKKTNFLIQQNFLKKYDNEKYFELFIDWKKKHEENYLEGKHYLNRVQIRHKKYWENHKRQLEVKLFF